MTPPLTLDAPRMRLEIPGAELAARVLQHHVANREHLFPWEPAHALDWLTLGYWIDRLERSQREHVAGVSTRFIAFAKDDDRILGVCNFTRFVREPLLSCTIGYHIDRLERRRGFATEMVRCACAHVTSSMGFTRVEATYDVDNPGSGRVLSKAGFEVEGRARAYLLTGGRWRDHVLTALVARSPS